MSSMVNKPSIEEYSDILNRYTNIRARLRISEIKYNEYVAQCIKAAVMRHAKTKEFDYVKIVGNTEDDERILKEFRREIAEINKELDKIQGELKVWEAKKDIFKSDSFWESRST